MRHHFIDISKGIGILLVVFGHNWITLDQPGELFRVIYSFHVPLFFFLSGLSFRSDTSLRALALRKWEALLKPYLIVLCLWGIGQVVFKGASVAKYYFGVLYATSETIDKIPLWFIPHLFMLFILSWFFCKLSLAQNPSPPIATIIVIALLALGYEMLGFFWEKSLSFAGITFVLPGLPLSADLVFVTGAFFLAGHYFSRRVQELRASLVYLTLALVGFASLHIAYDATIDLNLRLYDNFIVSSTQAILGICIVLLISKAVSPTSIFGRTLSHIGKGSLFVLIFHCFLQDKLFSKLIAFFPNHLNVNAIAAFFLTVAISLFLWELIKNVKLLAALFLPSKQHPIEKGIPYAF